jgi:hypothetical protein
MVGVRQTRFLYAARVIEVGNRRRHQDPPPHVVFEALVAPDRDPSRRWLRLFDDEQKPEILRTSDASIVVWSSLWAKRSDARVTFELRRAADGGTDLRWTLQVEEPRPDDTFVGHMRKRLNTLINANLRYSFGQ